MGELWVSEASPGAPDFDPSLDVAPDVFLQRLESYERVLLDLKDQLYEGSWTRILEDLKARLDGKPYVYKLSQTISRDVAAIERMKAYEIRHHVNLSQLRKQQQKDA